MEFKPGFKKASQDILVFFSRTIGRKEPKKLDDESTSPSKTMPPLLLDLTR